MKTSNKRKSKSLPLNSTQEESNKDFFTIVSEMTQILEDFNNNSDQRLAQLDSTLKLLKTLDSPTAQSSGFSSKETIWESARLFGTLFSDTYDEIKLKYKLEDVMDVSVSKRCQIYMGYIYIIIETQAYQMRSEKGLSGLKKQLDSSDSEYKYISAMDKIIELYYSLSSQDEMINNIKRNIDLDIAYFKTNNSSQSDIDALLECRDIVLIPYMEKLERNKKLIFEYLTGYRELASIKSKVSPRLMQLYKIMKSDENSLDKMIEVKSMSSSLPPGANEVFDSKFKKLKSGMRNCERLLQEMEILEPFKTETNQQLLKKCFLEREELVSKIPLEKGGLSPTLDDAKLGGKKSH